MTTFNIVYRAMNGHQMTDAVEAADAAAAIAVIKDCGMFVIVESVSPVADDFDDYNDDAADAFWNAAERRSADACNRHFGA